MNRFITPILTGVLIFVSAPVLWADRMEDGNHPAMYLRGNFNGWRAEETYRMSRDGDKYSISVPELNGTFKVGSDEWTYNFGQSPDEDPDISGSCTVDGILNGPNFNAVSLKNVEISFSMNISSGYYTTPITIVVDGQVNPTPVTGLSGTLPVLYINVYRDETKTVLDNEVISRDLAHKNYFSNAEYWLDASACQWMEDAKSLGSAEEPLPLEIKARGNWTRIGYSKKPFKLKLGKKQSLLGMSKSKHYAILAHADDTHGYLRNFTGFNLGHRIGLPWTPSQQPIEVVINGNYRGLYFLTESIRVGDDRVMIEELDDNVSDPVLCSGGYLVELDNYDEENQIRMEEKSCAPGYHLDALRITFDTPEVYSPLQRHFVEDQFTAMNDAVGANSDVLWRYMDLDDAVRYYIVEEIISHTEAYHGSTYLFRDRGEGQKWHFSPLWDCGNAFRGATDRFFYDNTLYGNTWIPSMRCNDTFNDKLHATWAWFMTNCYDGLYSDIYTICDRLKAAAKADYARWHNEPAPAGGAGVADNRDMDSARDYVLTHLSAKIDWLRSQWGDYTAMGTVSEPARDTTPAAPLPNYVSGVAEVSVSAPTGPVEYFTLDGIRASRPLAPGMYIRRQGSSATKVVVRSK